MGFIEDLLEGRDTHFTIPYGPGLWRALRRWPAEEVAQWNTILAVGDMYCGDFPAWLYVETALPALGEIFLALIDFDWADVARGYLRPAGLRSRSVLADVVSERFLTRWEIPELGEKIGARLPGAKLVKALTNTKGVRWLFKVDAVLQKALLYWMVVDLADDFFYHWASGIIRTEYCARSKARATYAEQRYSPVYAVTPGWDGLIYPFWPSAYRWDSGGGIADNTLTWWGSLDKPSFVIVYVGYHYNIFGGGWLDVDFRLETYGEVHDEVKHVPAGTGVALRALLPAGRKAAVYARVNGEFPVAHIRFDPFVVQGWEVD